MKIYVTQLRPRLWHWEIRHRRQWLFGGSCRTRRDARSDAAFVWQHRLPHHRPILGPTHLGLVLAALNRSGGLWGT
jgi:hypothetical protein